MTYHNLLKKRIKTWSELEKQIELLPTTKERGDVFEQFVYVYLSLNKNLYQIAEVYQYKNIPTTYKRKFKLEKTDCGVDGLMILNSGESAAYQAKFRKDRARPSYSELSKFWIEAKFTDHHYTIANCYYLSRLCAKQRKHLNILVDEFDRLGDAFFEQFYEFVNQKKIRKPIYVPFDFQKRIVGNIINGLKKNDRGKLIAACGTGKTLMALWATEAMKTRRVLFLAPSLALIKQTLESWSEQSKEDFSYLCICSDKTVSDEVDSGDITLADFNVPVTTSVDEISKYISKKIDKKQVIFSTYQSLDMLSKSLGVVSDFYFDLLVFDEAHRTAGSKNSGLFSLALDDQYIRAKKRLFMTATERLVRPWVIKKAKELERIVFSMDDESTYGPVFDRFNFGEAISKRVISDYRIVLAGVKEKEVYDWIQENKLLVEVQDGSEEYITTAQNIFRQIVLLKAMSQFSIKKAITFHSTVKNAMAFVAGRSSQDLSLKQTAMKLLSKEIAGDIYLDHINGTMSAGERKQKLDLFKEAGYGIISNARCLTEGVDVPIIDSIYFVNPKSSLIDIVQACGRALRKPKDKQKKMAYFIVPMLVPEKTAGEEVINEINFEMLHNLIQSLRDQDLRLAEWIDKINLSASEGKTYKFSKEIDSPIVLDLPKEFNVKKFEEKLYLRIAEVNAEPTRYSSKTRAYGRKERKSQYRRIFKTLGDYSVESYKNSLVTPTLAKFKSRDEILPMTKIKINNNNVSHTERLGLLIKDKIGYGLSPLGVQLYESKITFEDVFVRQMLRYFSVIDEKEGKRILFPYRACLKILSEIKSLNFIEFVFGLYSLVDSSEETILEAIEGIKFLRGNYPNIELLNEANKPSVLKKLNDYFGTNFSATDIWAKKTTINNQFIYFRNHLLLFDKLLTVDNKTGTIKIKPGYEKEIALLLSKDKFFEEDRNESRLMKKYVEPLILVVLFNL